MRINIKPLSVNRAWKGRRFRSDDYKIFEEELMYLLPRDIEIPKWPLEIIFKFWLSSKLSDWDNPIKTAQDVISKFYWFNDRRIYKWTWEKFDVKKWEEFIDFDIVQRI